MNFEISFPEASDVDASRLTSDLEKKLRSSMSGEVADIRPVGVPGGQGATTLAVILASGSVAWLAKGIHNLLTRSRSKIRIVMPNGTTLEFENTTNVETIIEKLNANA